MIGPAAGDSLQRIWRDSGPERGERVLRLRHAYLALAPDSSITRTELSTDGGETWDVVAHLVYRRR